MYISDSAGVLSTWERDDSACLHTVKQLVLMHKPPSPLILTPVHMHNASCEHNIIRIIIPNIWQYNVHSKELYMMVL